MDWSDCFLFFYTQLVQCIKIIHWWIAVTCNRLGIMHTYCITHDTFMKVLAFKTIRINFETTFHFQKQPTSKKPSLASENILFIRMSLQSAMPCMSVWIVQLCSPLCLLYTRTNSGGPVPGWCLLHRKHWSRPGASGLPLNHTNSDHERQRKPTLFLIVILYSVLTISS